MARDDEPDSPASGGGTDERPQPAEEDAGGWGEGQEGYGAGATNYGRGGREGPGKAGSEDRGRAAGTEYGHGYPGHEQGALHDGQHGLQQDGYSGGGGWAPDEDRPAGAVTGAVTSPGTGPGECDKDDAPK